MPLGALTGYSILPTPTVCPTINSSPVHSVDIIVFEARPKGGEVPLSLLLIFSQADFLTLVSHRLMMCDAQGDTTPGVFELTSSIESVRRRRQRHGRSAVTLVVGASSV